MNQDQEISILNTVPVLQEIVDDVLAELKHFSAASICIHPPKVILASLPPKRPSWGERLRDLKHVMEWARQLGVDPQKTRLNKYAKFIEKRLESSSDDSKSGVRTTSHSEADHLLYILREVDEWLWVYQGFLNSRPQGFNELFLKALGGNELAKDDQTSTRDYLFELKIASYFAQANCKIDLSQDSDLFAQVDNWAPIIIECKRIKSKKQVQKRLKEAAKQLKKRYKSCKSGCHGLAVIDVTKLINPNLGLTCGMDDIENRDTLRHLLTSLTDEFDFSEPFEGNGRLVSIWLHCMVPSISMITGEMSTRFSSLHLPMTSPNSPRIKVLRSLDRVFSISTR